MKLSQINYQIVCDVPGCGQMADYAVEINGNVKVHFCKKCLAEIKSLVNEKGEL